MKTVFCIEDEANIRELIEYTLKSVGFEVCGFENGRSFFDELSFKTPDIVLIDLMLPDMDGMEILKRIRETEETKNLPAIILTAKSGRMDKIKGLDSGADDYIVKPFDVLELVSRINAVLRRSDVAGGSDVINYKEIHIDNKKHSVSVSGENVTLTYKEYKLLYMLLSNVGTVLSREKITDYVWDTDFAGESRTLDVHIRSLRQKLGSAGEYIETVRNVGYKVG